MKINGSSRLIDALAIWGAHEAGGRLCGQLPASFAASDPSSCVDLVLRYRSPLIARILESQPISVRTVQIAPDDRSAMVLADGRTIPQWIEAVGMHDASGDAFCRGMADSDQPVVGPLICAAPVSSDDRARVLGPIVLYDGWHRAAAWWTQVDRGANYDIDAYLVLTKLPDRFFRGTQAAP